MSQSQRGKVLNKIFLSHPSYVFSNTTSKLNSKVGQESQCSSQTQSLNESSGQKKQQDFKENSQSEDDDEDQNLGNKQQHKRRSKMQQAYDKKPYIKGSRRFYKDGQVYYRTATKFFQPQKHYFHKQQSSILKSWVYGSGKTPDKISISSWNINGIRNALHKPSVCEYIKTVNPDILCLIEVKINEWNYKRRPVKLPGYQGYWNFCKCSAGYSGIAIFSKFQPISASQDFQERQFSQEGRVLTLEFQHFFIVVAYVPTAGQNLQRLEYKVNQYEKVFYKHCAKLLDRKYVIVAGDLNVCHTTLDMHVPKIIRKHQGKHPSSTKKQKTNFQKFLNLGFVDTFRRLNPKTKKFSWYNIKRLGRQKNLGKRLDYFLVDDGLIKAVTRSQVLSHIQGSDHCPIELNLDLSKLYKEDEEKRLQNRTVRQQYIKDHLLPVIKPGSLSMFPNQRDLSQLFDKTFQSSDLVKMQSKQEKRQIQQ